MTPDGQSPTCQQPPTPPGRRLIPCWRWSGCPESTPFWQGAWDISAALLWHSGPFQLWGWEERNVSPAVNFTRKEANFPHGDEHHFPTLPACDKLANTAPKIKAHTVDLFSHTIISPAEGSEWSYSVQDYFFSRLLLFNSFELGYIWITPQNMSYVSIFLGFRDC